MALAAKFTVEQSGTGYRWVLRSQGRTLATGPEFARRGMAERSITTFRAAAGAATVDDQAPTRGGRTAAPAKAARATGRAGGKAVGTGATAVVKAEKTAKRAAKKAGGRKRAAKA